MIRKWSLYTILIALVFLVNSCSTYTTFYSNTYSSIPDDTTVLKVNRLDLSNQNLETLPKSISKLANLKMLNLSGNPNLDLAKEFAKANLPRDIEILILDSLDILSLPKSIKQFSNLKQLSLAYNSNLDIENNINILTELPLEFLNLKGNGIKTLPENFTSLKSIKDLNLSYNKLGGKRNYEILSKLPNLYSLWLDHNDLHTLPTTIGELNQIRFLYIDYNNLQKLPKEMSSMKTWVIHAGYNNFKELPEIFTAMRSLLLVHINNNAIKKIPLSYETEKYSLAGLIMDNNPIDRKERQKGEELFKNFFIVSFEQK